MHIGVQVILLTSYVTKLIGAVSEVPGFLTPSITLLSSPSLCVDVVTASINLGPSVLIGSRMRVSFSDSD